MNYRATTLFLVGVILVMLALGPIIVAYSWLRYRIATMSDTTSRDIAGLRDDVWKSLTLGDETRRALGDHKRTFDRYRDAEAERHAEERGKRWFVPGLWAILSVVISSVLAVLVLNILGV